MPDWPRDGFEGSLVHSSGFKGSSAAREAGVQRAVVVGSNTSAHDVAQSLHEAGVHVTLVQRSPTTIISIASHAKLLMGAFLEDGMGEAARTDAEIAGFHSKSYRRLARDSAAEVVPKCKEADAALHRGLSEAGFALDWGEDESGLLLKFLRRGGGYYMSIGASELIAAGEVDVVAAAGVEKLEREGVVLRGGRTLPADLVVACTGYTNMSKWVERLCGAEVAAKVGRVYGYGSGTRDDPGPYVGELRNLWTQTAVPGLWLFAGNFTQARFYSGLTSLLIQIEEARRAAAG